MIWYKDFSNILALLAVIGGVVLLVTDGEHADKGWLLLTYTLGVGSARTSGAIGGKKSKGNGAKLILPFLLLLCIGCVSTPIPQEITDLSNKVLDRYDVYVKTDLTLESLERETYLLSSQILREFFHGGTKTIIVTGESDASTGVLPTTSSETIGSQ